jgi:hypothetical protein
VSEEAASFLFIEFRFKFPSPIGKWDYYLLGVGMESAKGKELIWMVACF